MSPKKDTQKSARSTTAIRKTSTGFTDEERVAMKERVQELKAIARRGPRAGKADGESAVLAKIAEMPEPDRAMGERLHAIIKASAPALSPRLWYGMPAYAKDGKVVCFFQSAQKFNTRYVTFGFKRGLTIYQRSTTDNPGCPEEIRIKKSIVEPFSSADKAHPVLAEKLC
jgi:hypothetical protein